MTTDLRCSVCGSQIADNHGHVCYGRRRGVVIVPAPRSDGKEAEDAAYLDGIRQRLGALRASAFDAGEFVECNACAAIPGSPTLCGPCLANRYTISRRRT